MHEPEYDVMETVRINLIPERGVGAVGKAKGFRLIA